jgi:hypothetical protein
LYPDGVALHGTFGAVVDKSVGQMVLFSTTNILGGTPTVFGTLSGLGNAYGVALQGTFGAVAGPDGSGLGQMVLFSTTNIPGGTPTVFGTLSGLVDPRGVALQGTFGAVCDYNGEMFLFSTINIPGGTPTVFGTLSGLSNAYGVALQGTFGAVCFYGEALLFSTTDIPGGTPVIFGALAGLSNPTGLALQGTFGAVTNSFGLGEFGEVLLFSIPDFVPGPTPTPSILPTTFPGNAGVTAKLLNLINGHCPPGTQAIINQILGLPLDQQAHALSALTPAFKIIQYSLEKLDLLLHKELNDVLYSDQKGTVPFILAGYDNLSQKAVNSYNGYTVQTYYQMLGLTHDWKNVKWLAGVGAAESYMNVNPVIANSTYPTVYGTLGAFGKLKNWEMGADFLFGYSFIKTHRTMSFINETASSSHGAWNTSLEFKGAYVQRFDKTVIKYYDNVSYLYGIENVYTETGAPGANFIVKNEQLSALRNEVGFKVDRIFKKKFLFKKKSAYKKSAPAILKDSSKVFVDASWVYDYYTNNNAYIGSFSGTDVFGTYKQTNPAKNFGRIHTGFIGTHKEFNWKLAYTGLFGKNFVENSASLKLEKQF